MDKVRTVFENRPTQSVRKVGNSWTPLDGPDRTQPHKVRGLCGDPGTPEFVWSGPVGARVVNLAISLIGETRPIKVWRCRHVFHGTQIDMNWSLRTEFLMLSDGSVHSAQTGWAPTDLVSLQPIKSWRWRAWPMNASCNWVDLLQVSSVHVNKP